MYTSIYEVLAYEGGADQKCFRIRAPCCQKKITTNLAIVAHSGER